MKAYGLAGRTLSVLIQDVGEVVTIDRIRSVVGQPDLTDKQVQQAVYNLRHRGLGDNIEVVLQGQARRYAKTPGAPAPAAASAPVATPERVKVVDAHPAYDPRPAPTPTKRANRKFEEIITDRDGTVLLRSPEGILYVAQRAVGK